MVEHDVAVPQYRSTPRSAVLQVRGSAVTTVRSAASAGFDHADGVGAQGESVMHPNT